MARITQKVIQFSLPNMNTNTYTHACAHIHIPWIARGSYYPEGNPVLITQHEHKLITHIHTRICAHTYYPGLHVARITQKVIQFSLPNMNTNTYTHACAHIHIPWIARDSYYPEGNPVVITQHEHKHTRMCTHTYSLDCMWLVLPRR